MGYFTGNGKDALALKDPYFNQVELLLKTKGVNGTDNGTFKDTGLGGHTITKSSAPIQGTFSPFSSSGWSGYFDGSGDYLTIASSNDFAFGTGDFTVEGFAYLNQHKNWHAYITTRPNNGGYADAWHIGSSSSGQLTLYSNQNLLQTSANVLPLNQWFHWACTRSNSYGRLFVNGQQVAGATVSSNFTRTVLGIGDFPTNQSEPFDGYQSNIRVVKGTSLYTASFTPPTAPLTPVANTKLLTLQDNRFIDNSASNHSITVNGGTAIKPTSPFRPSVTRNNTSALNRDGSAYFDGTDDYLQTPSSTDFSPGIGDWTVEAWVYLTAYPNGKWGRLWWPSDDRDNFDIAGTDTSHGLSIGIVILNKGGATLQTSDVVPLNQWVHLAVVRYNNTSAKIFFNGVEKASSTSFANPNITASRSVYIGANGGSSPTNAVIPGYISNVRYVRTALYTSNFRPPTGPLRNVPDAKLLLNSINAPIYDATGKNNLLTLDTTQINTTIRKFTSSSVKFDGSGDGITIPSDKRFDLGQPWTVECWFYVNSGSTQDCVFALQSTGGTSSPWYFVFGISQNDSYAKAMWKSSTINGAYEYPNVITANVWQHVACSYDGSNVRIYVNGTLWHTQSVSISGWQGSTSSSLSIGYDLTSNMGPFNGYLSDFRFTAGVARYTGNSFTLPTEEYVSA